MNKLSGMHVIDRQKYLIENKFFVNSLQNIRADDTM